MNKKKHSIDARLLRKRFIFAFTNFVMLLGLQSAVFAQTQVSGLDKIVNALTQLGNDLTGPVTAAVAVVVIAIAGYKIFSGSRNAVGWTIGAVAGVIIAFNASAIANWIKSL
jgi:type IV secretory pathway VirB2 component (pilin)